MNSTLINVSNVAAAGSANLALARKFLGVIYQSLRNNWVFEDFPNSSWRPPPKN